MRLRPPRVTQKVGQSIKLLTALPLPIIYLEIPEYHSYEAYVDNSGELIIV